MRTTPFTPSLVTRRGVLLLGAIAIIASCSETKRTTSMVMPTGPSPTGVAGPEGPGGGGVSRPAVVNFPPRPDALDFRMQLETKYASQLGRPVTTTYVDMEGEVAWIGEYDRYRVNGCDHNTATIRVLSQIDGAAPSPVCAVTYFPETAIYPPREHLVDFRRQLGAKYQSMGRAAQSAVDADGAAIWIGEYLRYRTSGCDHATAVQKTLTQVDGNPAPESCLQQCSYSVSPGYGTAPAIGGDFSAQLNRISGSCNWIAESEVPWISMNRPITGGSQASMTYTVAANTGGSRRGTIRVTLPDSQFQFEVNQDAPGANLQFLFYDPASSATPVTECQLKATNTICTLFAVSGVFLPAVNYNWIVEYAYNGAKLRTQNSNLPAFSFTEACGGPPVVVPISVRLIATDAVGNSRTLISGQGGQPALQLRGFPCP